MIMTCDAMVGQFSSHTVTFSYFFSYFIFETSKTRRLNSLILMILCISKNIFNQRKIVFSRIVCYEEQRNHSTHSILQLVMDQPRVQRSQYRGGGTLSLIFPQNGVPPSFVNAVEDHSMTSIFSLRVRNEGGVFTIAGRLKSVTPTPL